MRKFTGRRMITIGGMISDHLLFMDLWRNQGTSATKAANIGGHITITGDTTDHLFLWKRYLQVQYLELLSGCKATTIVPIITTEKMTWTDHGGL
jgi:hypothetical protein